MLSHFKNYNFVRNTNLYQKSEYLSIMASSKKLEKKFSKIRINFTGRGSYNYFYKNFHACERVGVPV